ncbi:hypothetical protein [Janthinobacterium sp. HLX7-2]|uniref:hypothetical protein n=1 Tax=Janthinobacterium sp. HLX7-2 TaxID=1259331 RepID=UPI003F27B4D0
MRIIQPLCVAMLALSASAWSAAAVSDAGKLREAGERIAIDESISLNNYTGWETPDLPYARLLAQGDSVNAAMHWSSAGAHQNPLAPFKAAAPPAAQQANVPPPVPEASMVSMLLVGLGLLAFGMHSEKQEKFDS